MVRPPSRVVATWETSATTLWACLDNCLSAPWFPMSLRTLYCLRNVLSIVQLLSWSWSLQCLRLSKPAPDLCPCHVVRLAFWMVSVMWCAPHCANVCLLVLATYMYENQLPLWPYMALATFASRTYCFYLLLVGCVYQRVHSHQCRIVLLSQCGWYFVFPWCVSGYHGCDCAL